MLGSLSAAVLVSATVAGLALAAEGDLDPNFNGGQPAVVSAGPAGSATQLLGVAKQADGKIVVVGATDGGDGSGTGKWLIERFSGSGQPDPGFGSGGVVTLDMGMFSHATGVIVQQADQRIVVGGTADVAGSFDAAFARLNADGSPDASFGTGGSVTLSRAKVSVFQTGGLAIDGGGNLFLATSVNDTSSGSLVGLGAIASVSSTGAPNAWAPGGILEPNAVSGARIGSVAAGSGTVFYAGTYFDNSSAQHGLLGDVSSSNGAGVAGFGSGGVYTGMGPATSLNGLLLAADGKLKATGFGVGTGPGTGALIASFNTSGANPTDTTFGTGGRVVVGGAQNAPNNGNAIAESGGKLFVAATAVLSGGSTQPALVSVDETTGALDATLGAGGYRVYSFGASAYSTGIVDPFGFLALVGQVDQTVGGLGRGLVAKVQAAAACQATFEKYLSPRNGPGVAYLGHASEDWAVSPHLDVTFNIRWAATSGPCPQLELRDVLPPHFSATGATAHVYVIGPGGGPQKLTTEFMTLSDGREQARLTVPALPHGGTVTWDISGKFAKLSATVGDQSNQAHSLALSSAPAIGGQNMTNVVRVSVLPPLRVTKLAATPGGVSGDVSKATGLPRSLGSVIASAIRTIAALSRPHRVEIALRRLSGSGAHSCLWLSNTRAKFQKTRRIHRRCTPIWLQARGTRHWSLRFHVPLPPGRYGYEARVIDVAGISSDPALAQLFFIVR